MTHLRAFKHHGNIQPPTSMLCITQGEETVDQSSLLFIDHGADSTVTESRHTILTNAQVTHYRQAMVARRPLYQQPSLSPSFLRDWIRNCSSWVDCHTSVRTDTLCGWFGAQTTQYYKRGHEVSSAVTIHWHGHRSGPRDYRVQPFTVDWSQGPKAPLPFDKQDAIVRRLPVARAWFQRAAATHNNDVYLLVEIYANDLHQARIYTAQGPPDAEDGTSRPAPTPTPNELVVWDRGSGSEGRTTATQQPLPGFGDPFWDGASYLPITRQPTVKAIKSMHITTIRPQQHRLDRKLLVSVADRSMTWRRAVEDNFALARMSYRKVRVIEAILRWEAGSKEVPAPRILARL